MTEELLPECMTWEARRPREEKRREEEEKTKSRDKTWTREEKTWPRDKTWTREEKREYTTWEQWSLWDQFGSTGEIIQVLFLKGNLSVRCKNELKCVQAFEEVAEGRGRRPWNREEVIFAAPSTISLIVQPTSR